MSKAEKLIQRERARKCVELSIDTQLKLGNRLLAKESTDSRREVLIPSILRAVNLGRAIMRLETDRPYAEAMFTLLRSLAELVINASYIQVARDEEVKSYLTYDSIMLEKSLRLAREVEPDFLSGGSKETMDTFMENFSKVSEETKDVVSVSSWTRLPLHNRAVAIDKRYHYEKFQFISRVIYGWGHSYTHSTFASLQHHVKFLETGVQDDEAIKDDADLAVFGVAQVLHYFNQFISANQTLDEFDSLMSVQKLIDEIDEAARNRDQS
jgi:hypothetical protein